MTRGKGVPLFTFTAHRRLYPGRGAPGKDGSLIGLRTQQYCCRLILKFAGFKRFRAATRLQGSQPPSETIAAP